MRLRIPDTILQALEEEAERKGVSPEAVLADMLLSLVPKERKWVALLEAAEASLEHAKELAAEGKLTAAFKRVWSAALLAVKAYAMLRGLSEPQTMEDYWGLVEHAGKEVSKAYQAWYAGLASDYAALQGYKFESHLEAALRLVKELVEELKRLSG